MASYRAALFVSFESTTLEGDAVGAAEGLTVAAVAVLPAFIVVGLL